MQLTRRDAAALSFVIVIFAGVPSAYSGCGAVYGTHDLYMDPYFCSFNSVAHEGCYYGELPGYAYLELFHTVRNEYGEFALWSHLYDFGYELSDSGAGTGYPREGFEDDANFYVEDPDTGRVYLDQGHYITFYMPQCV